MWWNFLNNLDELIIWLIAIIFLSITSIVGIVVIVRWIIGIFN